MIKVTHHPCIVHLSVILQNAEIDNDILLKHKPVNKIVAYSGHEFFVLTII